MMDNLMVASRTYLSLNYLYLRAVILYSIKSNGCCYYVVGSYTTSLTGITKMLSCLH